MRILSLEKSVISPILEVQRLSKEELHDMDMRKWFKEAQYGMMVHWGLYSLLAGEYKDRYSGVYAEWIQAHLAIPNAEYGKLTKAFNPVFFNAEEWVKLAKDCGMKYFVVTSKHHDGFAMFHSKVDKYQCGGRHSLRPRRRCRDRRGLLQARPEIRVCTTLRIWTGTSPTAAATCPDHIGRARARPGRTAGISRTAHTRTSIICFENKI